MPALGNQVLQLAPLVFAEGYVSLSLPGGAAFGYPVGLIQDVALGFKWTKKPYFGPGSKGALAVAYSNRKVEFKAKTGAFDARLLIAAVGGTAAYATSQTTVTSLGNDNPPILGVKLQTPSDGSDITLTATKCTSDSLDSALKTHEWGENDWSFEAHPDPAAVPANTVYTIAFAGNQTAS